MLAQRRSTDEVKLEVARWWSKWWILDIRGLAEPHLKYLHPLEAEADQTKQTRADHAQ